MVAKIRAPSDPDKFLEAIRWFRRRVPVANKDFGDLSDLEKLFAFRVANVDQARIVSDVFNGIDSAIAEGTTFAAFKKAVGPKLIKAWGVPDAFRVETTFRTNVIGAYNAGRKVILDDEDVQEIRPFLMFDAVGDSRTTDICLERDGTILPADDPFWKTNTPPLHFNCRSILVPVEGQPPKRKSTTTSAGDGFGVPPTDATPKFDIDFDKMPDPVAKELRKKLRDSP